MTALQLYGKVEEDETFLEKLRDNPMIKFSYNKTPDKAKETIRSMYLPKALACAVSDRFQFICDNIHSWYSQSEEDCRNNCQINYALTEDDIFGARTPIDDANYKKLSIGCIMNMFIRWLYTGTILHDVSFHADEGPPSSQLQSYCFYDATLLAHTMGASGFHDAVMFHCIEPSLRNDLAHEHLCKWLRHWWNSSTFSKEEFEELKRNDDIKFHGRKLLLYVLDCAAFNGMDESGTRTLLEEGGALAVQLGRRMEALRKSDNMEAPWKPENLHRYLMDDKEPEKDSLPAKKRKADEALLDEDSIIDDEAFLLRPQKTRSSQPQTADAESEIDKVVPMVLYERGPGNDPYIYVTYSHCSKIPTEPLESGCGHMFCKKCYDKHLGVSLYQGFKCLHCYIYRRGIKEIGPANPEYLKQLTISSKDGVSQNKVALYLVDRLWQILALFSKSQQSSSHLPFVEAEQICILFLEPCCLEIP